MKKKGKKKNREYKKEKKGGSLNFPLLSIPD